MNRTLRIFAPALVLSFVPLLATCGGDDDGGTDSGMTCRMDGNPCANDADCCSGTCGADMLCGGGGDAGGTDSGPADNNPHITRIEWAAEAGCVMSTAGDFAITVMVTDADTPAGDLTFTGNVSSCSGTIDAAMSTVNCPNFATYAGMVLVADPDGNTDSQDFSFGPCDTGGADF